MAQTKKNTKDEFFLPTVVAAANSPDTHGTVRKQCSLHDVTFEENITSKTGPHAHVVHFFSHETLKGNILKCCHLLLLFFFSLSLTDVSTFQGFQNAALTRRWNTVCLRS